MNLQQEETHGVLKGITDMCVDSLVYFGHRNSTLVKSHRTIRTTGEPSK